MTLSGEPRSSVDIDIFGGTYHVRDPEDPERLRELASLVDSKMKEVATHFATVDTTKIAILAALNIADELSRRDEGPGDRETDSEWIERVANLTAALEQAVGTE